jgi:hypothetical protein
MATIISDGKCYEVFGWKKLDEVFSDMVKHYLIKGYEVDPISIEKNKVCFKMKEGEDCGFSVIIRNCLDGFVYVEAVREDEEVLQRKVFYILNLCWLTSEEASFSVKKSGFEFVEEK